MSHLSEPEYIVFGDIYLMLSRMAVWNSLPLVDHITRFERSESQIHAQHIPSVWQRKEKSIHFRGQEKSIHFRGQHAWLTHVVYF